MLTLVIKFFRTLVLPTFHAHYLHHGILSPYQAIDVENLCQFVSCISVEELRKRCGDSFDVVFQVKLMMQAIDILDRMLLIRPANKFNNLRYAHSKVVQQATGLTPSRLSSQGFHLDAIF